MKKIKGILKEFNSYFHKINLSTLSASMTFYILIVIIPLLNLVYYFLSILEIPNFENFEFQTGSGFLSTVLLIFNIIWVSSRLINSIVIASDIVYVDIPLRTGLKRRIYSVILMIGLIIVLVVVICGLMFMAYLLETYIPSKYHFLIIWSQFLLQFLAINLIMGVIYKYVIPVKVRFRNTFIISTFVTISWYIATYFLKITTKLFSGEKYSLLYGNLASLFIYLIWIYSIAYLFLLGFVVNYYVSKKRIDRQNMQII